LAKLSITKEVILFGIIGGADGPTTIYLTNRLAPHFIGATAVAAYTYMAMVPIIQPPIIKALTTKKERAIYMKIGMFMLGIAAFAVSTFSGVILAKFMNLFLKEKINPMIGAAGVSAVPMASRVVQKMGQEANPRNFLLMHAMGPNMAGVIGTATAAGVFLGMLG